MAEFTMELKDVIETVYGTDFDTFNWNQQYHDVTYKGQVYRHLPTVPSWDGLGLGYYPIFDEAYRPILNGKIVTEFYRREICVETIDYWIQRTASKMQLIMPYYNKLYNSELIKYSALDTMNIDSTREDTMHADETSNGTNSADSDTKSNARAVNSTTPQTMLSPTEDYATGATDSNSDTTANSNSTNSGESTNDVSNNGHSLTTGYQGAASDLIVKFRNSFINIDSMVVNEWQELFMGILNSSDDYTQRNYQW